MDGRKLPNTARDVCVFLQKTLKVANLRLVCVFVERLDANTGTGRFSRVLPQRMYWSLWTDSISARRDSICFQRQKVYVDRGSCISEWVLAVGKVSIILRYTPRFHHLFSGVLVVFYVRFCTEPAVRTRLGAYTARAEASRRPDCFVIPVRAATRGRVHPARNPRTVSFWSRQSAQADVLPAAPQRDVLGDHVD